LVFTRSTQDYQDISIDCTPDQAFHVEERKRISEACDDNDVDPYCQDAYAVAESMRAVLIIGGFVALTAAFLLASSCGKTRESLARSFGGCDFMNKRRVVGGSRAAWFDGDPSTRVEERLVFVTCLPRLASGRDSYA